MQTVFLWTLVAREISHAIPTGSKMQDHVVHSVLTTSDMPSKRSKASGMELSPEQQKMIRDLFELFDTDGEQRLDEGELAAAIFAMGFSSQNHHQMASKFIDKLAIDGNRTIDLDQFTELMKSELTGRDPEEEIRATFARFATLVPESRSLVPSLAAEGSEGGGINLEQLKCMSRTLGLLLTEDELENMIKDADRNGGGDVDEDEYVQILKNSTWI